MYLSFIVYVGIDTGQHDLQPIATSDQSEIRFFITSQQHFRDNDLGPDNLTANDIIPAEGDSQRLEEFDGILSTKRFCQPETFRECSERMCFTGDPCKSFFSDDPAESPNAFSTTAGEMYHYIHIWRSPQLLLECNYLENKQAQVRNLLQDFLVGFEESDSGETGCAHGFGTKWPFRLVAHIKQSQQDFRYTPSDFHLRINGLPRCILEVNSTGSAASPDRYWMLLQAGCLARLANSLRKPGTKEAVVIMAIYVDVQFVATQYLLCQPDPLSNEVRYLPMKFDLRTREGAFRFMFRLYNFKSQAVRNNSRLGPNLFTRISKMKGDVSDRKLEALTSTKKPPSKRKRGGASDAHDPAQPEPSYTGQTRGHVLDEPAIMKMLEASGYTLTKEVDGFERFTPVKPSMREATAADGSKVVIKPLDSESDELKILRYLNDIKSPKNHTIELVDAFEHPVGNVVVLPWHTPLRELLDFRRYPHAALGLRTQFLEGVAFLHENKIAHLDLNPSNVVVKVDGPLSARSLRLLIIDYGLSVFVESEETLIDCWCGTRGWIAPEAGSEDGPDVEYSPILADRWACGRMMEYFSGYIPQGSDSPAVSSLCLELLSADPKLRPRLEKVIEAMRNSAFDGVKRSAEADDNDLPEKRARIDAAGSST